MAEVGMRGNKPAGRCRARTGALHRPQQAAQAFAQLRSDGALADIAHRAQRARLAHHELVLGAAEDGHPRRGVRLQELPQPLQALAVGQVEVQQHGVDAGVSP
jgi:hypothetical protein